MMSGFLANNRDELVARCKAKVALRPRRAATTAQLSNGVPLFITQLQRTLEAEEGVGDGSDSARISGASGGTEGTATRSEMEVSATAHGRQLLELGYSIDQVVHDYGDLCQSITDLAVERDAPFAVDEFRTLNRCLDNAIASAVSAFTAQRDMVLLSSQDTVVNERVSVLIYEIRNAVSVASYAVAALEQGNLPVGGSTGAVLKRSLATLKTLVTPSRGDTTPHEADADARHDFSVMSLVADAKSAALLYAPGKGVRLTAGPVDPGLRVLGDYVRLSAALDNILQNAFKFTLPGTEVTLEARADAGGILIDVSDHCGGLAPGTAAAMFKPFSAHAAQGSRPGFGLGLGLLVARESVEADGGALTVLDMPGVGCTFSIRLPRSTAAQ